MTTPLLLEATKTDPTHAAWLEEVGKDLLEWGAASRTEHGFGWLDSSGTLDPDHDLELWINCRMTHCFALASIRGTESSRDYAELAAHGLSALSGAFHDDEHGGFYSIIARETGEPVDDSKQAYAHAFVVLAASSLVEAHIPGAGELLETALEAHARFFESGHEMFADTYSRDFSNCEDYRGINANMHSVEGLLAASAATGRLDLFERAAVIVERALAFAKGNGWFLPEHFTTAWEPRPDYNREDPAHPFRPYGATIGHSFEWARLALHTAAGFEGQFSDATRAQERASALRDGALALAEKACETWGIDGDGGFPYTVDWDGSPVVHERMHWVVAEAIGAAAVLFRTSGDAVWEERYESWWQWAKTTTIVPGRLGSWVHELTATGEISETTWKGQPDIYHAYQVTLIPRLPAWPPLAHAVATEARSR